MIEVGLAVALPLLYWFETQYGGLLPQFGRPAALILALSPAFHACFIAHAVLLILMTAATFIDFDERTVPDVITIPGTILALLFAAVMPDMFMVGQVIRGQAGPVAGEFVPTMFHLPNTLTIPPQWAGRQGLIGGMIIWSVWCFALSNRRVILRHGIGKAVRYFFASMVRRCAWKLLLGIWIVGLVGVYLAWSHSTTMWNGVFTSLVGLSVGGGVVWAIRIVGSLTLGKEAMGFGDVTLMAMIGAYIGWQASLSAFFLAPFAAIGIVVIMFILTRDPATPFGPYLCAGAVGTIVMWDVLYNGSMASLLYILGPQLKWFGISLLVLMGVLLGVIRVLKKVAGLED